MKSPPSSSTNRIVGPASARRRVTSAWTSSTERPATLFYGDFDGTGTWNVVEAEFDGNEVTLTLEGSPHPSNATGGRLAGLRSLTDSFIPNMKTQLDQLARVARIRQPGAFGRLAPPVNGLNAVFHLCFQGHGHFTSFPRAGFAASRSAAQTRAGVAGMSI